MMKHYTKYKIALFFTSVFFLSVATIAFAKELEGPIECNGDEIEYFQDEKKVVGKGHVIITYKDSILTCDKVTVWTDTKDAKAEGNVKITQGKDFFTGESITYNLEKQTGTVVNFGGFAEPWYYVKGKMAERTGPDEFIVNRGYVTTCDHKKPHYRISARKVLIYPNSKVVIKDATFWLGPIPVLWIPVYVHPLDDNRPRVTVIPGKSSDWGAYLLTAWRYNLDANNKGYVHLDYRERKGTAAGFDYIYNTEILGNGILKTYYAHEKNIPQRHFYEEKNGLVTVKAKDLVQWRHKWQMAQDTTATVELYKYRDQYFRKDYFSNEYDKDTDPLSYLLVTKTQPIYNLSVLTQARANGFESRVEKLPEVKLAINSNRIDRASYDFENNNIKNRGALYYEGEFSAVNLNAKYPRSTDENPVSNIPINHNNRYDTYNKLSYATNLYFLNVTPHAAVRQTYYDRGTTGYEFGSTSHIDGVFYTGVDISTKFYKALYTQASPLGIEINNLRHIITPSISYNYNPPSTLYGSNIFGFLGGGASNSMSFSLENKLQTKRKLDKSNDMGTVDLARLGFSTSYSFNHTPGGKFSDYTAALELLPYNWLTITSNATIDSHKLYRHRWLKQIGTDVTTNIKDFTAGLSHSYILEQNNIVGQFEWRVNPKWKLSAYESFDIKRQSGDNKKMHDLKEQRYVLTRDLHCWEVDFHYAVNRARGEEILVVFRIKAFPDMPFTYGKNYHEPKRGSQDYSSMVTSP